jgi:hypothetical protein
MVVLCWAAMRLPASGQGAEKPSACSIAAANRYTHTRGVGCMCVGTVMQQLALQSASTSLWLGDECEFSA